MKKSIFHLGFVALGSLYSGIGYYGYRLLDANRLDWGEFMKMMWLIFDGALLAILVASWTIGYFAFKILDRLPNRPL